MGQQIVGAVATQMLLRAFDAHAASLPAPHKTQARRAASALAAAAAAVLLRFGLGDVASWWCREVFCSYSILINPAGAV